jgi:deoxycytidylate deaminase
MNCSKMIINAGIRAVVAKIKYPDDVGLRLFKEAGVQFRLFSDINGKR